MPAVPNVNVEDSDEVVDIEVSLSYIFHVDYLKLIKNIMLVLLSPPKNSHQPHPIIFTTLEVTGMVQKAANWRCL